MWGLSLPLLFYLLGVSGLKGEGKPVVSPKAKLRMAFLAPIPCFYSITSLVGIHCSLFLLEGQGLCIASKVAMLISVLFNYHFQLGWSPAHADSQVPASVSKTRHRSVYNNN